MKEISEERTKEAIGYQLAMERVKRAEGLCKVVLSFLCDYQIAPKSIPDDTLRKIMAQFNDLSFRPSGLQPESLIPKIAVLAFDPLAIEDRKLRKVWKDPIARTLWLAWKWRHLTDQNFNDQCLKAAAYLTALPVRTLGDLSKALGRFPAGGERFIEELLPYVTGQKQIGYEVDWEAVKKAKAGEALK